MLPPQRERDQDASDGFAARVRRAIQRRLLASSLVEFCVRGPALAVLELVLAAIGCWRRGVTRPGVAEKETDQ